MSSSTLSQKDKIFSTKMWPDFTVYGVELVYKTLAKRSKDEEAQNLYILQGATNNDEFMAAWRSSLQDISESGDAVDPDDLTLSDFRIIKGNQGRRYLVCPVTEDSPKSRVNLSGFNEHLPMAVMTEKNVMTIEGGARAYEAFLGSDEGQRVLASMQGSNKTEFDAGPRKAPRSTRAKKAASKAPQSDQGMLFDTLDLDQYVPIGVNKLGKTVFEGVNGRFYVDSAGNNVTEEAAQIDPMFLRVGADMDDRIEAAYGHIDEMVTKGRVFNIFELEQFVKDVLREEVTPQTLSDAKDVFESAAIRYVSNSDLKDEDRYFMAVDIFERMPRLMGKAKDEETSFTYRTPLPFAELSVRLLGGEDAVRGKKLFIPAAGSGAFLTSLPKDVEVTAFDINPHLVPFMRKTADIRGLSTVSVHEADATKAAFPASDMVIANPPAHKRQSENFGEGLDFERIDYQVAMRSLQSRSDDGVGVFILAGPQKNDADKAETRRFYEHVYKNYNINGHIEASGMMFVSHIGGPDAVILVIGEKLPEPLQKFTLADLKSTKLNSHEELWRWSQAFLDLKEHKEKVIEAEAREVTEVEQVLDDKEATAVSADNNEVGASNAFAPSKGLAERSALKTNYQAPYRGASRGRSTMMVPRMMEMAHQSALSKVAEVFGDVDEYVANAAGWTVDELFERLDAEQIDAVALYLHARDVLNRGFMNADEPGAGKGRVLATIAHINMRRGETVVFVTKSPNLYSDIYRDFKDIGAHHDLNPYVMNQNHNVVDLNTGDVLVEASTEQDHKFVLDHGALPFGKNIVFTSFSQINNPAYDNHKELEKIAKDEGVNIEDVITNLPPSKAKNLSQARARAFAQISRGAVIIADEAHMAAGQSNTATNIDRAIRGALNAVSASATPANTARNVASYAHLFPKDIGANKIYDVMQRGGALMMEQFANLLATDGVYVRREHNSEHMNYNVIDDDAHEERNISYTDEISSVFQAIIRLSGDISKDIDARQQKIAQKLKEAGMEELTNAGTKNPFGSRLDNLTRAMVVALKADAVVGTAINQIEMGRKPYIPIDLTMGSLLQNLWDELSEAGSVDMKMEEPDMKHLLKFTVKRMLSATIVNERGKKEVVPITDPAILNFVDTLNGIIDDLPDLPVSSFDYIKKKINDAGYSIGEVSGRAIQYDYDKGALIKVKPSVKEVEIRKYNNGDYDAIIGSRSISTGASLHASPLFKDQRQRVMIQPLMSTNIKDEVQFRGRIRRKGQLCEPENYFINSKIMADVRLQMMAGVHAERLSASTTANKDNVVNSKITPLRELISSAGNKVALKLFAEYPDLAERLGIEMPHDAYDYSLKSVGTSYISKFLSRLLVLKNEDVKIWSDRLNTAFKEYKEEMARQGFSLSSKEMTGEFKLMSSEVYDFGEPDRADSMFYQPVYHNRYEVHEYIVPMKLEDLYSHIQAGENSNPPSTYNKTKWLEAIDNCNNNYLSSYAVSRNETVEQLLEDRTSYANMQNSLTLAMKDFLEQINLGDTVSFKEYDWSTKNTFGVVTSITPPEKLERGILNGQIDMERVRKPGSWGVLLAVPGNNRPSYFSILDIILNGTPEIGSGINGDASQKLAKRFSEAKAGIRRETVSLLEGNMFNAIDLMISNKLGSPVSYTDTEGRKKAAVLLNKDATLTLGVFTRVPFAAVKDFLTTDHQPTLGSRNMLRINTSVGTGKDASVYLYLKNIVQRSDGHIMSGTIKLDLMPGGSSKALRATKEFEDIKVRYNLGAKRKIELPVIELDNLMKAVDEAGMSYFATGEWNQYLSDWYIDQVEGVSANETVSEDTAAVVDIEAETLDEPEAEVVHMDQYKDEVAEDEDVGFDSFDDALKSYGNQIKW